MNELEYRATLKRVLEEHLPSAAQQLKEVLANVPASARAIEIVVFPDADGEGTFDVRVTLEGPDLSVLNQSISEWAVLFEVRHTESGLEPNVPLMEPSAESFEVNDAVVDCAAEWVHSVWQSLGDSNVAIPVAVVGHDDYGTITPLDLNS